MYSEGIQAVKESSHCSSAKVVPLIWWYRKVADPSAKVTLASLAKRNALSGSALSGAPPSEVYNTGFVPLIQIAYCKPNIAISDWRIRVWFTESPSSDHNRIYQLNSHSGHADAQFIPSMDWANAALKFPGPLGPIKKKSFETLAPETGGPPLTGLV